MKKNILLVLSLMFISLVLVGCGDEKNVDDATKDSINKGDSNAAVALLVEYGIDLNSLKPDKTVSTVTYEEVGDKDKGIIFFLDKDVESNRKETFVAMLDYFKVISSDGKIYDYKNKEYDYQKEVADNDKEQEIIYTTNNNKVKLHIEFSERDCPKEVSSGKCETYGIVFE